MRSADVQTDLPSLVTQVLYINIHIYRKSVSPISPQCYNIYIYSNAKITHICSVWYLISKLKYAGNDKIWNALLMH